MWFLEQLLGGMKDHFLSDSYLYLLLLHLKPIRESIAWATPVRLQLQCVQVLQVPLGYVDVLLR